MVTSADVTYVLIGSLLNISVSASLAAGEGSVPAGFAPITRPPIWNFGISLPNELIDCKSGWNIFVERALTTNSPFDNIAGIESDVVVPGP